MAILITGATGLVGTRLAHALFEAGQDLAVIAREPAQAADKLGIPGLRAFSPADLATRPAEVLRDVRAIVHLAGESIAEGRWTEAKKKRILDSRVELADALVRAIGTLPSQSRPQVLVSAAATGIYGDRGDEELREASGAGPGFLAEVCRRWEEAVAGAEAKGVRALSLRFGVILSRGQGMLGELVPLFKKGLGGRVGGGAQWVSWVHAEDVVRAIQHGIAGSLRGPVNLVAPEPLRQRDLARALAEATGMPAALPVPAFAIRLALGEKAAIVLDSQRVLPDALVASGFQFAYPTLRKALEEAVSPAGEERFEAWQFVPQPLEQVFAFFANERNLERITPPWVGFEIRGKSAGEMRSGTLIDYRIRLHGLPMKWRTRIEAWDPPRAFRDIQLAGPYRLWEHDHSFAAARGGTVIRDRIRYQLPGSALGGAVAGAWVGSDVAKIFEYRRFALAKLLPAQD